MKVSEILKLEIEKYATRLRDSNSIYTLAQVGELTPPAIVAYVTSVRFLIEQSNASLGFAQKRAEELGEERLARFFQQKAREEEGHAEWAKNDIMLLSALFKVTAPVKPAKAIADLLEYLHVMIGENPLHYVAYILFAEYLTVLAGPEWLRLLEDRCGIPNSAMSVVGNHIELDKKHVSEGLHEIDSLVGNLQCVDPMLASLHRSMDYFDAFCSEIGATVH